MRLLKNRCDAGLIRFPSRPFADVAGQQDSGRANAQVEQKFHQLDTVAHRKEQIRKDNVYGPGRRDLERFFRGPHGDDPKTEGPNKCHKGAPHERIVLDHKNSPTRYWQDCRCP
jgi:hypothetical protein